MKTNKTELRWKKDDGRLIFGGCPVGRTGKEAGLLLRLNLLKDLALGKTLLSVGCGVAAELKVLKKKSIFTLGLDPERSFLCEGKIKGNADEFIQAIGERLPLRDGSFDLVLLFEVLEHVIKPEVTLKEICRVLKPNGTLFLTVPNRFYIFETHGIQICRTQIHNLLGIGIPFFSIAPQFLRRKFERARIFTEAKIIFLLRENSFEPFIIKYLMPPLDIIKQTSLTLATRKVFLALSNVPIIKMFGANIMVISKKK